MPSISEDEFQKHLRGAFVTNPAAMDATEQANIKRVLGYLLLDSAYDGMFDRIVALLESGASVDATDENTGMTALHIAVGRNNLEIARILVEHGASFIADKQGRMPSTVAAECEVSEDLCDFIAEAEARAEGV